METNTIKLYETDYVLVNNKTNTPIEGFDIVYNLEGVRGYLYDSNLDEEEIQGQIDLLEANGELEDYYDCRFISMTKLSTDIQKKYIETLNQIQ